MITLATSQASTWGYSVVTHTSTQTGITGILGDGVGMFTKLTLGPNGKFYSIYINNGITVNGITYPQFSGTANVIVEITPGTTNTRTTNWSRATFNYLTPDPSVTISLTSGFGKPSWPAPQESAGLGFNTGILAPNNLIYFAPLGHRIIGSYHKWLILNPISGQWKFLTLYPGYPTSSYPNGVPALTSNAFLSAPVLGPDGLIYVLSAGLGTIYRFQPTSNALGDEASIEQPSTTYTTTNHPLIGTTKEWVTEAGTLTVDPTGPAGTIKAAVTDTNPSARSTLNLVDAIAHPNGNIYWIPGNGRGRIFYTKPSLFGVRPFVSATGLLHTKEINCAYAFLEKPRDADHDPNTLKIYIVSKSGTNALVEEEVLCLDPVTHTLSVITLGMGAAGSGGATGLGKNITLANGMHITKNYNGALQPGRTIFTGWDVPSTAANGVRTIPLNSPDPFNAQGSAAILGNVAPGQSNLGGGANVPYPHHSKFVGNLSTSSISSLFTEIVSVKQYGPEITNFNFTSRDIPFYSVPSTGLAGSIFNANFNKQR